MASSAEQDQAPLPLFHMQVFSSLPLSPSRGVYGREEPSSRQGVSAENPGPSEDDPWLTVQDWPPGADPFGGRAGKGSP